MSRTVGRCSATGLLFRQNFGNRRCAMPAAFGFPRKIKQIIYLEAWGRDIVGTASHIDLVGDNLPVPAVSFEDPDAGGTREDIHDLVLRLSSISATLVRIADGSEHGDLTGKGAETGPRLAADRRRELARFARSLYRGRRNRNKSITSHLFGEPGWDMLLHLFVNKSEARELSTKSLCLASGAPQTTALRWIGQMEKAGLIERLSHTSDCRVTVIRLTDVGEAAIHNCLDSLWTELRAVFALPSTRHD